MYEPKPETPNRVQQLLLHHALVALRVAKDRTDFLRRRGFSKAESGKIIEKVLMEEGRPPESIFDFVQGITRLARDKTQQDARLDMEGRAKKLLDRVG